MPGLERVAGLKFDTDSTVGYSPERINPGDRGHRMTSIVKITSGSTPEVAEFVDKLYGSIIKAGTHKASSIRVADPINLRNSAFSLMIWQCCSTLAEDTTPEEISIK